MLRTAGIFALLSVFLASPAAAALKLTVATIKKDTAHDMVDVTYPHTGVAAIDADLDAEVKALRKQNAWEADDAGNTRSSLDISYEVPRNDAKMLVVVFAIETFAGGAHPNHEIATFNYLLPYGARVYLPEIVGRNGIRTVSREAAQRLLAAMDEDGLTDADWIRRGTAPYPENFDAFAWLPGTLRIYFSDYQIAPYVSGEHQVDIPLTALKGRLWPDWRAPLASFDCAKPASAIEHAICADAALARLDRRVAEQYDRVRRDHDRAEDALAYEGVRADQRNWLAARDRYCARKPPPALPACLARAYRARLNALRKTY